MPISRLTPTDRNLAILRGRLAVAMAGLTAAAERNEAAATDALARVEMVRCEMSPSPQRERAEMEEGGEPMSPARFRHFVHSLMQADAD